MIATRAAQALAFSMIGPDLHPRARNYAMTGLRVVVILLGILFCAEGCPRLGQDPTLQARLLGVWHLSRFEAVRSDKSTFIPFGAVSGQLVYSSNGQVLVAWSGAERRRALNPSRPTPEEIAGWFRGFDAYWGTFKVDPGRKEVT